MNETAGLDATIATTIRTLRAMREAQSFEACMADHE